MFYRLEISILQVILFVAVGSECAINCPSDERLLALILDKTCAAKY